MSEDIVDIEDKRSVDSLIWSVNRFTGRNSAKRIDACVDCETQNLTCPYRTHSKTFNSGVGKRMYGE